MHVIDTRRKSILKSIAFVCCKLSDGLTHQEICSYFPTNDNEEFVLFCSDMGTENKYLVKQDDEDRYCLTKLGREFLTSQFG